MKAFRMANHRRLLFPIVLVVCLASLLARAFDNGINDLHGGTPAPPGTSPPPPPPPPPPPCDPTKCPPDPNCNAGDPVYPANGKFYLQLIDYELAGELPITIRRFYSTLFAYNGFFGYGWNMSYNERLYRLADGNLLLRKDNDTREEFTNSAPRTFRAPVGKYESISENLDGTYTLRKADGTIQVYNNDGTLAKVENLKGYQLLFTYDPAGKWPINGIPSYSHILNPIVIARDYRLVRIDQAKGGVPSGRAATFRYNADGRMTNIAILAGNAPPLSLSYAYANNGSGDLINYTDVKGTLFNYVYDNLHRMTNFPTAECACRSGQNIYDSSHRVTRQILGNTVINFEYLVANTQTRVTTHIYDDQTLQLLRDRIEYFNFTASGKTSRHVIQMGRALDPAQGESDDIVTVYRYNSVTEELLGVDEPAGGKRTYTYDGAGNIATEVFTNGTEVITKVRQYDINSRLTNQYVASTLQPGIRFGQRAASFDANGRVLWEKRIGTNGGELVTSYQYQTVGDHELVTLIDPEGNRMARESDAQGKLLREFDPDRPAHQTRYEYDERGNPTNRIDALGSQTRYAYDEMGRLIREKDALNQEDIYTFSGSNLEREEFGRSSGSPGRIALHYYNANSKRIATYKVGGGATNLWMRWGHDSDGNLIWEENALGGRTGYEYDPAGRLTIVTDWYGGRTTNSYDKAGNTISVKNTFGIETRMEYDRLNRLTNRVEAATTAVGRQKGFAHDPVDNLTTVTWPDGSVTVYVRDEFGRLAGISGTRERTVSYIRDGNDRIVVTIDGNGNSRTNQYNAYGKLIQATHPDGARERFFYDDGGRMTSRIDANTNATYYTYDALGRVLRESSAYDTNRAQFLYNYNAFGALAARSNALGGVERIAYDSFGRMTNSISFLGLSQNYIYDELDRLVATVSQNGSSISNTYAGAGLAAIRDRAGRQTRYGYDALGRRIYEITALGVSNRLSYDALNRLIVVSNSLGHATRFDYDSFDQVWRVTRPDGLIESQEFDSFGQVTNRTGAGQYPVAFRYDGVGNRVAMTDGNGHALHWQYDNRNRMREKQFSDGTVYQYTYDKNGNLRTRLDPAGVSTLYSYDQAGRLAQIDYPSESPVAFEYDLLGRRTALKEASGTNRWFYSSDGKTVTNFQGAFTLICQVNEEKLPAVRSVNGVTTLYRYDTAGQLASVSNSAGIFSYAWHPQAQVIEGISYPNGAVVSNAYNPAGWLTNRTHLGPGGAVLGSYRHERNLIGLTTNLTLQDARRWAFEVDGVGQLVSASGLASGGLPIADRQYSFTYDGAGNRLAATNGVQGSIYRANLLNQYTQIVSSAGLPTTNRLIYDANGNLRMSDTSSGVASNSWDHENRLRTITQSNHRSEFTYNALNLCTEQKEYENGILQQRLRNVYDGGVLIAQHDELANVTRFYTRGADLSQTLTGAGGIGGLLAVTESTGGEPDPLYYLSDSMGNVVDLLSSDASVVGHYEYDPFGGTLVASGTRAAWNTLRFSSKPYHEPSGLYDFSYRRYDPRLVRWTSRDKVSELGMVSEPYAEPEAFARYSVTHRAPSSSAVGGRRLHGSSWADFVHASLLGESSRAMLRQWEAEYVFARNNPTAWWDADGLYATGTPVQNDGDQDTINCRGGQLVVHPGHTPDNDSDATCTRRHEDQHRKDWINRYGPDLCKGVTDGYLPLGGDGYDDFLKDTECNSYKVGKKCREDQLKCEKDPAAKQKAKDGIARDDAQIAVNCK